jgi:UDP-N-acetylmuramoylalanine--D-glutamate ligase
MQNLTAAFAASIVQGLDAHAVISAIASFKGLRHRMQFVCEVNGLKFINDSKATNADSCLKALETYDEIYWIAGGICKDDGIEGLRHTFHKIKHAYLVGQAADEFAMVLDKYKVAYTKAGSLENSCSLLKKLNPARGVVLLSPSCSSLDQWRDFEKRGDAFCALAESW